MQLIYFPQWDTVTYFWPNYDKSILNAWPVCLSIYLSVCFDFELVKRKATDNPLNSFLWKKILHYKFEIKVK